MMEIVYFCEFENDLISWGWFDLVPVPRCGSETNMKPPTTRVVVERKQQKKGGCPNIHEVCGEEVVRLMVVGLLLVRKLFGVFSFIFPSSFHMIPLREIAWSCMHMYAFSLSSTHPSRASCTAIEEIALISLIPPVISAILTDIHIYHLPAEDEERGRKKYTLSPTFYAFSYFY